MEYTYEYFKKSADYVKSVCDIEPEIGLILGAQFPDDPTDLEVGRITAQRIRWFRDEVLGMKPWSAYEVAKEELLACASEVAAERFAGNAPMPVSEELCRRMLEEWY